MLVDRRCTRAFRAACLGRRAHLWLDWLWPIAGRFAPAFRLHGRKPAGPEILNQREQHLEQVQDRFLDRPLDPPTHPLRSHRRTHFLQRVPEVVGRGRGGGGCHGILRLLFTNTVYDSMTNKSSRIFRLHRESPSFLHENRLPAEIRGSAPAPTSAWGVPEAAGDASRRGAEADIHTGLLHELRL